MLVNRLIIARFFNLFLPGARKKAFPESSSGKAAWFEDGIEIGIQDAGGVRTPASDCRGR
jgi:hypothetical protein